MKCTVSATAVLPDRAAATGHDWVLVPPEQMLNADYSRSTRANLLWACPCGEFKWTSYAEWDSARRDKELADLGREHPVGTAGMEMTPEKWQEAANHMKRMT